MGSSDWKRKAVPVSEHCGMKMCGGVKVNVAPRSGHLTQGKEPVVDAGFRSRMGPKGVSVGNRTSLV